MKSKTNFKSILLVSILTFTLSNPFSLLAATGSENLLVERTQISCGWTLGPAGAYEVEGVDSFVTSVSPNTIFLPGSNLNLAASYSYDNGTMYNLSSCRQSIKIASYVFSAGGYSQSVNASAGGTLVSMPTFSYTIPSSGINSVTASVSGTSFSIALSENPEKSFSLSNTHTKDPNAPAPAAPVVNIRFQ